MTTGPVSDEVTSGKVREQLSAWLDDELPAAEMELLSARLQQSAEDRALVARYGLIGSCIRGRQPRSPASGLIALQLSERVGMALSVSADDVALRGSSRWRQIAPFALAAGLAVMAVVLIRPAGAPQEPEPVADRQGSEAQAAFSPVRLERSSAALFSAGRQASLSPNRLTSYLVYHGEYAGALAGKVSDSHIVNQRSYAVVVPVAEQALPR